MTTRDSVPVDIAFLDLHGVNNGLREEFDLAWKTVLDHGHFVGGPEVERFEREFATYCGTQACVGVANGTDALELILRGLGIGIGDEVIVPTNTFIATAEAVCATGARPRFVDVCAGTLLIDPDAAQAAINSSTAAIIAVHLYGQMVDPGPISAIAAAHGLALIEDAAQAHGARHCGATAGSVGIAAGFSFYPGKNLGALGDGGAVVTSDLALAETIRSMANHGRCAADRYRHDLSGRNSRLDTLQAALLSAKLPGLDAGNARRAAAMAAYRELLPPTCLPVSVQPGAEPVYHLAVVQVDDRDKVGDALTAAGIGWGVHYPIPCHEQPALATFHESAPTNQKLPVAERAASRILSLPMSPTLSIEQVARVCDVLGGAL
ncbi:MAG TPA: DegT/DnrJ/EryC1/StrS family aminotransferase [Pseudonocardiaceae bacterium]|jgi:dTDP-4-amino-4,6-dideoxygalactose transaminase|nr:DegT/DnrJ/EryC1/StrS family aminotransferase [Pseudonocardiaceae bacterium]